MASLYKICLYELHTSTMSSLIVPTARHMNQACKRRSPAQARAFFISSKRSFSATKGRNAVSLEPHSSDVKSAHLYCSSLVRNFDSPSYTLAHFIPPHMLPAYMAIRAFNIEVARIPDIVSNPTIGAMRMQFWRQTVDSAFEGWPPEEPVAVLLASYIAQGHKVNRTWFHRIINSRDRKLTQPGFTSISDLETYAESTYSTLLYLTLSALPLESLAVDHLASHIGKAAGITAILRGVPLLAFPPPPNHHSNNSPNSGLPSRRERQGIITLPLDVMAQCGVREEDIFRSGGNANGLRDAVFAVATRASDHLITARSMLKNIQNLEDPGHDFEHIDDEGHDYSKSEMGSRTSSQRRKEEYGKGYGVIMGPAISAQLWLDRLQQIDFDIFHNSLRTSEWKLPFVAWWRNRSQTF